MKWYGHCKEKFCNLRRSGSAHIAFHDQLTSDSSLQMISRETVNSEGDRTDLEGQNFLQLYRHAVQMSIGRQRAALVLTPCPDLCTVVLPGSYGANLY